MNWEHTPNPFLSNEYENNIRLINTLSDEKETWRRRFMQSWILNFALTAILTVVLGLWLQVR
jgi:hypothetical protein